MKPIVAVFVMVFLAPLNTYAWSLFGPKTYEECIQVNMKGVASDKAAVAVEDSCYTQFLEAKDNALLEKKKQRFANCGIPLDIWKYRKVFSIDTVNPAVTDKYLNNIKNLSLNRNNMQLSLQNNNDFGVSYLKIGFIKGKTCPTKIADFESTIACSTNSSKEGVQTKSFGTLSCDGANNKDKNLPFCLASYSPVYDPFNEELITFMEKNGYCGKK